MKKLLTRKQRDRLWKKSLKEAKKLKVVSMKDRFKIVELAIKCCDIYHGGRRINSDYSVSKFAEELNLPRHPPLLKQCERHLKVDHIKHKEGLGNS